MNRIILGVALLNGIAGCAARGELATKESVAKCEALPQLEANQCKNRLYWCRGGRHHRCPPNSLREHMRWQVLNDSRD